MKTLVILFLVPLVMVSVVLGIIFVCDPSLAEGFLIMLFPLACAYAIIGGLITIALCLLSIAAQKAEYKIKEAAANDPVYNNLPPLGQARVDIERAKQQKYFGYIAFGVFGVIMALIFPLFWFIPVITFLRWVILTRKESNEAIAQAEAKRNQILNS